MEIIVRHAEPGDYVALHRIYTGPRAAAGTLQLPFRSAEHYRKWVEEPADSRFALVACVEGEVVGGLTLSVSTNLRRRHVGHVGMAVRDDWQGRGVGTALMEAALELADNWLALIRVELDVYTDNDAALALYKKFGFVIEGTHTAFAFRDGVYVDAYSMARIRPR